MKKGGRGFTIVELLIVIVVIAILASISIVAYNGVQQRARDSRRAQDLASIEKSLKLYNVDNVGVKKSRSYNNDIVSWDASDTTNWLSFLTPLYGAMPTDPVNERVSADPPAAQNRVYYYYCYSVSGTYPVPTVVIGYNTEKGTVMQKKFEVDNCLD